MVKAKSLSVAFGLLLTYQAWLNWARPRGTETLTFSQGNFVRAQRFVHERRNYQILFCGSSLTFACERFMVREDSDEIGCLALVALGARDGLEMIERTGKRPRLLLLEINHFDRAPNRVFLEELLRPGVYHLRGTFSALRHGYQPGNLLIPWLQRGCRPEPAPVPQEPLPRAPEDEIPPTEPSRRSPAEVEEVFRAGIRELPGLYQRTEKLRAAGVRIGFYEIPEHPDVRGSAAMQKLRDAVSAQFPEADYGALIRDTQNVYYTDSEHLRDRDGRAFAYFLLQQARARLATGR